MGRSAGSIRGLGVFVEFPLILCSRRASTRRPREEQAGDEEEEEESKSGDEGDDDVMMMMMMMNRNRQPHPPGPVCELTPAPAAAGVGVEGIFL